MGTFPPEHSEGSRVECRDEIEVSPFANGDTSQFPRQPAPLPESSWKLGGVPDRLHALNLTTPAIFLLELHKPLRTLLHQGTICASPMLSLVFGKEFATSLETFFESPDNIEQLIKELEACRD